MYDYELKFLVDEIKGLLKGLEKSSERIRFDLASDNIYKIDVELCVMKKRLEYIEQKNQQIKNTKRKR